MVKAGVVRQLTNVVIHEDVVLQIILLISILSLVPLAKVGVATKMSSQNYSQRTSPVRGTTFVGFWV